MGNSGTGKLRIGIPVFEISVDRYEIYRYAQPEVVCLWLLVFTYGMLDFAERVGCIIHVPKVPAGGEGSCFDPGGEDGGRQTSEGSFSAIPMPIFESKYTFAVTLLLQSYTRNKELIEF